MNDCVCFIAKSSCISLAKCNDFWCMQKQVVSEREERHSAVVMRAQPQLLHSPSILSLASGHGQL